jgi:hypothetical protein
METGIELKTAISQGCDCCQASSDKEGGNFGCAERSAIFTRREQEILGRIREARQRADTIKAQLQRFTDGAFYDPEAKQRAVEELEKLRRIRSELEEERIAAAEERMRLLGHA